MLISGSYESPFFRRIFDNAVHSPVRMQTTKTLFFIGNSRDPHQVTRASGVDVYRRTGGWLMCHYMASL